MDLFGPSRVKTAAGMTYMMVISDAATSHTCIYFLQSKRDAFEKLEQYQPFIEKQSSFVIRRIRSDGGGEFDNGLMSGWCKQLGIMHVMNAPYSSTQNAIAERRIGIILNDTRTLLLDSHLPLPLWGYAAAHAVYIRNRLPSKEGEKSPHQLMFKRKPRLDHLRPFGCAAFTWLPDRYREDGKLNARAQKLVLVGFEEGSSNARLYNLQEETFLKSRDVRYFEDVFPARGDKIPDLSFLRAQWETSRDKHLTHQENRNEYRDKHLSQPEGDHRKHEKLNMWSEDDEEVVVEDPDPPGRDRSESPEEERPLQQENIVRQQSREPSRSPIVTRSTDRAAAMRQRAAELRQAREATPPPAPVPPQGTIIHEDLDVLDSDESDDDLGLLVVTDTPSSMTDALEGEDSVEWRASMKRELHSIDKAGTWEEVEEDQVPKGTRPIDSRLVLAVKLDPTGGDAHICKTRLVAKGFSQRPGIDFYDTFSPVGHRQSFRQMLSIVASLDWGMQGLDISTAFLHGDLDEEVYMRLPKEVDEGGKRRVVRLKKALYGLKQAGKCWNDKIDAWLQQQRWEASPEDACIYIKKDNEDQVSMMLYIHVDDSAIAAKDKAAIDAFIDYLDQFFPLKRQPLMNHMIGMEIHRDRSKKTLWITQHQYIKRVLEKFNLTECKPNQIPLRPSASASLMKATEEEHQKAKTLPYRELMGCLQYLATMTVPDICYAVNKLSSFCSNWSSKHFELAKGILRYVAGTRLWGLQLSRTPESLLGFVDADYNGCLDERKSTSGWLVQYRGGTIVWRSRKQQLSSHSTAESEYIAVDDIARDLVWERRALAFLEDQAISRAATHLNVDNQAAIALSRNRTNHDSTKHIDSRYHDIRSLVASRVIFTSFIDTDSNHADILTKALAADKFFFHAKGMGVGPPVLSQQVGVSAYVSCNALIEQRDLPCGKRNARSRCNPAEVYLQPTELK